MSLVYANTGLIGVELYSVQEAPKWHGFGRRKTYIELEFKPAVHRDPVSPFLLKQEWVWKPKKADTRVLKQYHSDDRMLMLGAFR